MSKGVNLNSAEWRDIIFEDRNKSYGAYKLRATSSKRHVVAFVVAMAVVVVAVALPSLVDAVKPKKDAVGNIDEAFELAQMEEQKVEDQDIIQQQTAPPPPPLKATIQFTPPVITEDSKVDEEKEMKTVEELKESKEQISIATVAGTDDPNAVDIAELQEHKEIVEEKQEKPFQSVEQMPQFPGGDAELLKYVSSNLRYPTIAAENGIEGRVVVRFVVNKDGVVSDAEVLRPLDPSCDKEALRVVRSMPKWVPGKQNGRNVAVYYTLPVRFQLQK